jgi:hypothetical protein
MMYEYCTGINIKTPLLEYMYLRLFLHQLVYGSLAADEIKYQKVFIDWSLKNLM